MTEEINVPVCVPMADHVPCYIPESNCNFTKAERESIGCHIDPAERKLKEQKIEELVKLDKELTTALITNLDINAGKPRMGEKEQELLIERDKVREKLAALGYVKPPKSANNPDAPESEEPTKKKRKRRKKESHSRAARAGRAAGALTTLADEIDSAADNICDLQTELTDMGSSEDDEDDSSPDDVPAEGDTPEDKEAERKEILEQISQEVERISKLFDDSFSTDEIQNLADEMRSWSDNVQGTNLENSDKMQTVSETADTMESAASNLDGLTFPEYDESDIDSYITELEQLAGEIRDEASNVENCEFPGMYG